MCYSARPLPAGNPSFLEKEYEDLKYAGVQDVVPGTVGRCKLDPRLESAWFAKVTT